MPKNHCHRKECTRSRSEFSIFSNRRHTPQYEGYTFCSEECLGAYVENELKDRWRGLQFEKGRRIPRPKLGTILMQTAFVTRDQLEKAVQLQSQTREGRIGDWLLRLGFVEERQVTAALARQFGLPLLNLKNTSISTDAVRMIPGKVAKCSGLMPVGFDDGQTSLRVAVTAPVDFNTQEAIRRMVHKGIVAYVGAQSTIQKLLEQWYTPEDLDLSNVPTFGSWEDLVELCESMISTAIHEKALNIQAELVQEFFWMRLDFSTASHHHFFRFAAARAAEREPVSIGDTVLRYATAH